MKITNPKSSEIGDTNPQPPPSGDLPSGVFAPSRDQDNFIGQVVNEKYHILELIGQGGMACVYRARQVNLPRMVAIKILSEKLVSDNKMRKRFYQEAQIQSSLRHPGIVHVTDLIDEPNFFGMVMDFIDGCSLSTFLTKYKSGLPITEIARLFLPILDALECAHRHNVIHRDLKPDNILLEGLPGEEFPRITDFGIARLISPEINEHLTNEGMLVGTLSYMSPEQIQTPRCADHRTDIYALGIILFFMATGRYPFGGEGYNLLFQHISGELPRLRDVSAQADVRLEPIIRKAMAKNPEDRYDNCREFALDLRQVIGSDVAFLSALVSFKSGMPLTTSAKEKAEPVIESKHTPNAALLTTDMLDLHYAKQLQTTVDNPSPLARNTPIPSFIDGSNNAENTPDVPHFGPYLGRSSRRLTLVILAMIIVAGLGLLIYQSGTDRPPSVTVDHADSAESLPPTSISPPVPDSPVPNTKKSQQASLHPDTKTAPNFTLYLNSKPSAADVFVNGQRHGTTPLHISAPQGKKLHIRLSKQGYLTEEFFWLSQSSENKSIRMIYDL